MMMRSSILISTAAVALAACGDFDSTTDRFTCASDEDCSGENVCAGHTIVGRSATSYCVEPAKATVALGMTPAFSPFTCEVFGATPLIDVGVQVDFSTDATATSGSGIFTSVSKRCSDASTVAQGGTDPCWTAQHERFGNSRFLIIMAKQQPGGPVAKMFGRIQYFTTGTTANPVAVFEANAVLDDPSSEDENPNVEEVDVRNFDPDVAEQRLRSDWLGGGGTGLSNRCSSRALARATVCGSTPAASDLCDCVTGNPDEVCPGGYFCIDTHSRCWPISYAATGEECSATPDTRQACMSQNCQSPADTCI